MPEYCSLSHFFIFLESNFIHFVVGVYITKNKRAKLRSYQIILRTVILPDGRLHTHSQYQLLFDKVFLKLVCFPTPPIEKPNCMLVRYSHNPASFLERVFNISRTL